MKFKYPKFLIFFILVVLAIGLYKDAQQPALHDLIISLGYFGTFVSGMLYTYGFTTPFATALLLVFDGSVNIFLAAAIAGLGAVVSDLIIFKFIRKEFSDEIISLSHEKIIERIEKHIPPLFREPIVFLIAGIIAAAPIPDEIAVSLLATYRNVTTEAFILFSYIAKTIGIYLILYAGTLL